MDPCFREEIQEFGERGLLGTLEMVDRVWVDDLGEPQAIAFLRPLRVIFEDDLLCLMKSAGHGGVWAKENIGEV